VQIDCEKDSGDLVILGSIQFNVINREMKKALILSLKVDENYRRKLLKLSEGGFLGNAFSLRYTIVDSYSKDTAKLKIQGVIYW